MKVPHLQVSSKGAGQIANEHQQNMKEAHRIRRVLERGALHALTVKLDDNVGIAVWSAFGCFVSRIDVDP